MGMKHQNHRYPEGQQTLPSIFIWGFPLYDYLMTVSTLIYAYLIARYELSRVE